MKILLYGDYSSLHKNLADGLRECGHLVSVASNINSLLGEKFEITFSSVHSGLVGEIEAKIVRPFLFAGGAEEYDVVQFINPLAISPRAPIVVRTIYNKLIARSAKSYLLCAGDDFYYIKYGVPSLKYSPLREAMRFDAGDPLIWMSRAAIKWNQELARRVDGLIPVAYDYAIGYRRAGVKNVHRVVPLPVNIDKIDPVSLAVVGNRKLRIFHGFNRYGFKGTRHIEKAFSYLNSKYSHDVECVITKPLPLNEYLRATSNFDVCVDQVLSYSYGMSAAFALARGQIVISGAEPESLKEMQLESSPVLNAEPDWSSVVKQIEALLDKRSEISELKFKSRQYAERVHSHVKVAETYARIWSN